MSLYHDALERGLSVMPINALTGVAIIEGWQVFSDRLPTEEECDFWEENFPVGDVFGIALVSGKASNAMVIDIDTDDPEVHKLVPKSEYGKRGLPGRASYIFQFNAKFNNISEHATNVGLYHHGKYSILPPSRHRKFNGSYVVLGKDLFSITDTSDLPVLDSIDFFDLLPKKTSSEFDKKEGRNNFCVRAITAMRMEGKSEDEIIDWIYDYDLKNHKPRLFTDPKESFRAKNEDDVRRCIHKMVTSVTRTLLQNGANVMLPSKKNSIAISFGVDKFEQRSVPVPSSGIIPLFVAAANASSKFDITPLAVGGALSFLSAICANRVRYGRTWPNIYVVGLAQSGLGKGSIPDLIKELLGGTNLLGADMYRSSQSFIETLPEQPQRLDVIDEAAPFFDSMKSTASYTSDLSDVVNRLYSLSNSRFDGFSSVRHGKKTGACNNPCVSIYASTHQIGFLRALQGYLASSGLMPRFLIFEQSRLIRNVDKFSEEQVWSGIQLLKDFVRSHLDMFPMVYNDTLLFDASGPLNKKPSPFALSITSEAKERLNNLDEEYISEMISLGDKSDSSYVARQQENLIKVAMLTSISKMRKKIEIDDVEYANDLVKSCFFNAQLIRGQIVNSGRVTGPISRIEACIRRKGGTIDRTDLMKCTDLKKRDLDESLEIMMESGRLHESNRPTGSNRKVRYYTLTQTN